MTSYDKLISAITKMEKKKKSVSVGNVREVLKVLKTLCNDPEYFKALQEYFIKK